jgi:hypothetical protein
MLKPHNKIVSFILDNMPVARRTDAHQTRGALPA